MRNVDQGAALAFARAEAAKLADIAACIAGLSKGRQRANAVRAQRRYNATAISLADALDGPIPSDIAEMDDAALLMALEA
ncbi:hypothetical protein [Sphingomonas turrisvirgatae]|uniref:Uncharacterized protein n=1 Tax=Sphingomonas turrisvirgatae TaxID=1888892 RepID=A0A1E3LR45_9SPHN|nr:hypothetical protein [Sphingomonas turrisvirgatae]ODP36193.1 hypothetical protein BFL28_07230 [Sphingomonas turrisvirgatae]